MEVIKIQTEIAKLGLDLGGVMAYIVDQTLPLTGADGAAIELAEGDEMVYRASSGIAESQIGLRLKMNSSLSGTSVLTGKILNCKDAEIDPRVDRIACQRVGLRSMIVMPLLHKGVTVGVLKAMSAQTNKFVESEVTLLGMLSEVISAAMYNSVKYDVDDLFHKATHDGMTGLANRSLFMDRLRNIVIQSHRDQRPAGVLIIDMDGLKQINDTHGHRIGDIVIKEFAKRIKSGTRDSDTVARLGGDEFGVILSPVELPTGIESAINRIDRQIQSPFVFEGKNYPLQASIGAAVSPTDSSEMEKLLELADQRMYAVKRQRYGRQTRKPLKPKTNRARNAGVRHH